MLLLLGTACFNPTSEKTVDPWVPVAQPPALGTPPPRPTTVVLISIDNLRADALGLYGAGRGYSPNIDQLGHQGVVFEHTVAAASSTLASHTSLFTGRYTVDHGVPFNGVVVPSELDLLGEFVGDSDWQRGGILGGFPLAERFGLSQGFDTWTDGPANATQVTNRALKWIDDADSDRPKFLFVHYWDVHHPWIAPARYQKNFQAGDPELDHSLDGLFELGRAVHRETDGWEERSAAMKRAYQACVAYTDAQIGRLMSGLKQRGLYEDALIIVTADHGETMAEHWDTWSHGLTGFETNTHIPLIIKTPGVTPRRVPGTVSNVDIAPTIAHLVGSTPPVEVQGRSLRAALQGGNAPERMVFSQATQPHSSQAESDLEWPNQRKCRSVWDGDDKLQVCPLDRLGRRRLSAELFDLKADPGEQTVRDSDETQRTRKRLRRALDRWAAQRPEVVAKPIQDTKVTEQLEALGYFDE